MNRIILFVMVVALLVVGPPRLQAQAREDAAPQGSAPAAKQPVNDDKHLVYADFEQTGADKQAVSARGGAVGLFPYQAPGSSQAATTKGIELVHVKPGDPNHLLKFDYALFAPSDWTGVVLEVHGQPDVDGKMVTDDLSEYKFLSLDCYATGVPNHPGRNHPPGTRERHRRSCIPSTRSR